MPPLMRIARTLAFACLCLLLLAPGAEAGRRRLFADFDADGRRDRVTLDAREPWIVRIWLSATRSTHIIRSAQPLRDITLVDLNGDRRPELIATGRSHGLQVWTKAAAGFVAYPRQRSPFSRDVGGSRRHRVDDNSDEFPPGIATAKLTPGLPTTSVNRRRASPHVGRRGAEQPPGGRAAVALTPLSPRPPPTSI
jgi:hypothetical protein